MYNRYHPCPPKPVQMKCYAFAQSTMDCTTVQQLNAQYLSQNGNHAMMPTCLFTMSLCLHHAQGKLKNKQTLSEIGWEEYPDTPPRLALSKVLADTPQRYHLHQNNMFSCK